MGRYITTVSRQLPVGIQFPGVHQSDGTVKHRGRTGQLSTLRRGMYPPESEHGAVGGRTADVGRPIFRARAVRPRRLSGETGAGQARLLASCYSSTVAREEHHRSCGLYIHTEARDRVVALPLNHCDGFWAPRKLFGLFLVVVVPPSAVQRRVFSLPGSVVQVSS